MIKAYTYKLKPTIKQQKALNEAFGCVRFIYNWGLNLRKTEWEINNNSICYYDLAKELALLKKKEEFSWLRNCANESLQQSLRSLENAYKRFFNGTAKYPKFKSKKHSKSVVKFTQNIHFDFINYKVKVPKIGWIKFCKNREFDRSKVKQGILTIYKDSCNEYWAIINLNDQVSTIPKAKIQEETTIGLDLGIKDYVILSNGIKYGNPKFLEKQYSQLASAQQRFAKTKVDSKRHERLRLYIAKIHKKIVNRRKDFLYKLASELVTKYDTICIENLSIEDLKQKSYISESIQSAAWNIFIMRLKQKAEELGKNIIEIGRFEPSSKLCHNCGYINNNLTLNDRNWICPQCGIYHDRDINAAINIKNIGLNIN